MGNYIIGITGGIASGKSTLSSELESLGCYVIRADLIAHEIMHLPEYVLEICKIFGDDIFVTGTYFESLFPGKFIERKILRERCMEDPSKLIKLNDLLQAEIRKEIVSLTKKHRLSEKVVWDIPLLYEQNYDLLCDYKIFVDASYNTRMSRAMERGWTKEEFDFFESKQVPLEYKKTHANYVFWSDNALGFARDVLEKINVRDTKCKS
jgi:dephospho-CoA kinase